MRWVIFPLPGRQCSLAEQNNQLDKFQTATNDFPNFLIEQTYLCGLANATKSRYFSTVFSGCWSEQSTGPGSQHEFGWVVVRRKAWLLQAGWQHDQVRLTLELSESNKLIGLWVVITAGLFSWFKLLSCWRWLVGLQHSIVCVLPPGTATVLAISLLSVSKYKCKLVQLWINRYHFF